MDRKWLEENKDRYTEKAKQILSQMDLEEKVALMSGDQGLLKLIIDGIIVHHYNKIPITAGGNSRLKVPQLKFCDGPRGVVSGNSTCFPVSMQRGASFDIELEERVGEAIGKEIRAHGGNYYGGICMNLLRHPAGGRSQETFGEDPFHVGQMASATTRGVQKHNVIGCLKHFALNNQENARFKVDVTCDERTLREVYLAHFKDCVDAGAASIMGAYNKFRGEHICQNAYLLKTIVKEEWGFYGFVISDFVFAVKDTVKAANSGLDVEMCNTKYYGRRLIDAVKRGDVPLVVIDEAALRIIRTLLHFSEAPDPLNDYPRSLIASQEHVALALEVAEKSLVLLKNERSTLPFKKTSTIKVVLIGELANTVNTGDHGSSWVHPPYVITPLQGVQKVLGSSAQIKCIDGKNLDEAKKLAAKADAVILVAGYSHKDEGEYASFGPIMFGGDRDQLGLHAKDVDLIKAIAPLNANTVVVLIGSNAILMEEWKSLVPAILHAFYPGMEGGMAIARALFGEVNPGGKLPFTIPTDVHHLPDFDKDADHVEYGRYHGYTKLEKDGNKPAFAFGFGLSYTTFSQSNAAFSIEGEQLRAAIDVTNNGERSGDQVIQLYVGFENSAVYRPKKLLRGFKRVTLQAGETKRVEISCPVERLCWYNPTTSAWELERMTYQAYIGSSSRDEDLLKGDFSL